MTRSTFRSGCVAAIIIASLYGVVACSGDDDAPASPAPDASMAQDASQPTVDAGPDDAAPETLPVSIKFKAKVGTQDFKCGTEYPNQGSTSATVQPQDLRFFVQDLALVDSSGKEVPVTLDVRSPWQLADVALLDFEDGTGLCTNGNAELNDVVTGRVPPGTYTGVAFTNGVPFESNHLDPVAAPAPLSSVSMSWGWLLGYLFIRAEVATPDGGVGLFHLGSTGCSNTSDGGSNDNDQGPTAPCAQPNRNRITLPAFDAASNAIVLDVATLFGSTDLAAKSTCHSMMSASCGAMFTSVGLDYDGGARLTTAPAFRVE